MSAQNPPAIDPKLVDRVKGIILQPKLEWPVIAAEPATVKGLFTRYAMILAAIGPVCGFIGAALFGFNTGIVGSLVVAIVSYVLSLVVVYVLGIVIDALASSFGSEKNMLQSMKLAVYAYTPAWVAGVLGLVPMLAGLALLAAIYGIYLMYLGFGPLKKTPEDKLVTYTIVTVLVAFALQVVVGLFAWAAALPFVVASAMVS
ncbi:hypothetical protein OB03_03310 [Brevundimonas sp. GN22]|uniref:Yip1 family protein n=1 Tax=Brevundimonas pishanensis TaxID=2896315 RepID=UPI001FA7A793|nr:Yip1 family protein [Brevundimonas pishanensis]